MLLLMLKILIELENLQCACYSLFAGAINVNDDDDGYDAKECEGAE